MVVDPLTEPSAAAAAGGADPPALTPGVPHTSDHHVSHFFHHDPSGPKLAPFNPSTEWIIGRAVAFLANCDSSSGVFADLGCGDGRVLAAFWHTTKGKITSVGLEYDQKFVGRARQRFLEAGGTRPLEDIEAFLERFPVREEESTPPSSRVENARGEPEPTSVPEPPSAATKPSQLFLLHTDVTKHAQFIAESATRLFVYLVPSGMKLIEEPLRKALARPGVRIASYMFRLPERSTRGVAVTVQTVPYKEFSNLYLYESHAALASTSAEEVVLPAAEISEAKFLQDGFLVLEKVFSKEEIENLRRTIVDPLLEEAKRTGEVGEDHGAHWNEGGFVFEAAGGKKSEDNVVVEKSGGGEHGRRLLKVQGLAVRAPSVVAEVFQKPVLLETARKLVIDLGYVDGRFIPVPVGGGELNTSGVRVARTAAVDIFGSKLFPVWPNGGRSVSWHTDSYYFGTPRSLGDDSLSDDSLSDDHKNVGRILSCAVYLMGF